MLDHVKIALRVKTNVFDDEIQGYIDDCLLELAGFGIYHKEEHLKMGVYDKQIQNAVVFYCKLYTFCNSFLTARNRHFYFLVFA